MSEYSNLSKNSIKISPRLIFASLVGGLGTFQFGWNLGVINNPQSLIKDFVNETMFQRNGHSDPNAVDAILATIIAIFAAGGLLGALCAGWIGDKFGRLYGMLVDTLIMVVAGVLMATCTYGKSFEMLIIGRTLAGFGSGLYTGLVPVYLNEIAPLYIRGSFGMVTQFGVVIGLFLSQVCGLSVLMGQPHIWNFLLGLIVIFALIQAVCIQFCPPSPRYLLYFKDDKLGAKRALQRLRAPDSDIDKEFEDLIEELKNKENVEKMGLIEMLKMKNLRMTLFVGVVLHFSQQFSGVNNIFYYSSTLFTSVGVPQENSEYATLGVGLIMITVTLVSIFFIDKFGRKTLHIGGLIGCLITSILFTIFFSLKDKAGMNYLSIISALLFVASFGSGPGSIPWLIMPEMFSESTRSTATSVGISVNWLSNLIVGLIFPFLLKGLGSLIFLPFIVLHVICIVFFIIFMPETKGKRPDELNIIEVDNTSIEKTTF